MIRLTSGSSSADVTFNLDLGGSVTGVVTDGTNPLEGVRLSLRLYDGGWRYDATSALDGTYTFTGLSTGMYRLEATKIGYAAEYYENFYIFPDGWLYATPITVTAGSPTTDINFELEPGGSITFTVYNSDKSADIGRCARRHLAVF